MPETYDECKERFGVIFHNNFAVSIHIYIYSHLVYYVVFIKNSNCIILNIERKR